MACCYISNALVFITFKRKNYNKATLWQLSDILYHAAENEHLVDNIKQHLNAFTEKKGIFSLCFKKVCTTMIVTLYSVVVNAAHTRLHVVCSTYSLLM